MIRFVARTLLDAWLRKQPEGVRSAVRNVEIERNSTRRSRQTRRALRGLNGKHGLKLHLGCGPDVRKGWINFDFATPTRFLPDGSGTVLAGYDLRLGLPVEDDSASLIYSSHFFEHLEYRHFNHLLRECWRVLEPGGRLRLGLPDFERIFQAYVARDAEYLNDLREFYGSSETTPETESLIDLVHYSVHQFGEHRCVFDREKLYLLLRSAGFHEVEDSSFEEGLDLDVPIRRKHSLYLNAFKR